MKFVFSPDAILCGWLGWKHQLTLSLSHTHHTTHTPHHTHHNTHTPRTTHNDFLEQTMPFIIKSNSTALLSSRAHLHVVGMLRFTSGINQPSLPTPFYSVLVSASVFMALSTVFHSINSSDNSPLSDSVLPVLSMPYWSFQLYIFLWKSPSALI